MKTHPYTFESWPRRRSGDPIITSTEQATFFAHLVSDKIEIINLLTKLRKKAYFDIGVQRSRTKPNGQIMMDLAFRAQFYRECLEEIKRINESQYEL